MANTSSYSQGAINSLQSEQDKLQNSLQNSPESYSVAGVPSSNAVRTDARLRSVQSALDKLQAKQINAKWYGANNTTPSDTSGTDKNLLFKGLDALAKPLYAISGAAKYVTGDKSGSFFNTVNQNMNTDKSTFGDILSKHGVSKMVSAPLGFALDVAFDPVNWLTMGTGALIPKMGFGLLKGASEKVGVEAGLKAGLEATGQAVKQKALGMAAKVSKYIPGISKDAVAGLGTKAIEAGDRFNALTGRNVMDIINKRAVKPTVGNYVSQALHALPGGDWVTRNFAYSPEEWFRVAKIQDAVENAARGHGGILEPIINPMSGLRESPNIDVLQNAIGNIGIGGDPLMDMPIKKISDVLSKPVSTADNLFNTEQKIMSDGIALSDKYAHLARSKDSVEQITRMLGEAKIEVSHQNVVRALNELSGVSNSPNVYDKLMTNIRGVKIGNVKIGSQLLDAYSNYIGVFKSAKIGFLSPASVVNATVGNPVMLHMFGADITRPEYLSNLKKARNFIKGANSEENFINNVLLQGASWQDFINRDPGIFQKTFGFSGNKVLTAKSLLDEAIAQASKVVGGNKLKAAEVKQIIRDTLENKQSGLRMGSALEYSSSVPESQRATDFASQELTSDAFLSWKADLEDIMNGRPATSKIEELKNKITPGDPKYTAALQNLIPGEIKQKAAAALHWALTKPSENYSQIDQAFKLGTALTWVENGLTEKELLKMTKSVVPGTRGPVSIESKDFLSQYKKGSETYYKLTPEKATEMVNLVYMNYAAMPAAVKVLRSLPMGSPFFSFQYAMAAKLGQTLVSNPAAFNKVSFALHEASGNKTPLVKEALNSPYYSFLSNPGMLKLPFFQENPLYLNVANMIPYYSMNMFMPNERKYQNTLGDNLAAALDKTPFLKDPVGQTIFDYFIQPMIIKDSLPQGSFGQPLYPAGTTALGKAGYALRNLAEAPLPGAASALAFATPESALPYVPSYRWRQLGYALKGKTPIGALANEPATSRTLRAIGSNLGLSTSPIDLTYAASSKSKK